MRWQAPVRLLTIAATAWPLLTACGGSASKPEVAAAPAAASSSPTPLADGGVPESGSSSAAHPAASQAPAGAPKAAPSQAPPDSPVPPGVDPKKAIATVNGRPIEAEKVYSFYESNKIMLAQRGQKLSPSDDQILRVQSLQVVMADELLYQAAQAAGVKATPAEVDAQVKQWRSRVGSEENYKKFLQVSGLSEADVRHELQRNYETETYKKGLAAGKGVTEQQALDFYKQNPGTFKVPEQAHIQYILVKATDKDPETVRADARKRAEEAQKRATAGEDFAALAKQYSQDATAAKGGDIGFFPRGVMFPKFEEIAFGLKPGGVSPVFETPNGFNVMKLLEVKPPSTRPFEEVKTELMLEMGQLVEQKVVSDKVQELGAKAKIEVLDEAFKAQVTQAVAGEPTQPAPGTPAPAGSVPVRKIPAKKP